MGRGNHPSFGGCLEQSCANHLIFQFAGNSVKLKREKKMFSPNQREIVVVAIFGEPKNWRKTMLGLNVM